MQLVHEFGLRHRARKNAHGCDFCGLGAGYGGGACLLGELVNSRLTQTQGGPVWLEMA